MNNEETNIKCLRCKRRVLSSTNNYISNSGIDFNGFLPICKVCIQEIYDEYMRKTEDTRYACFKTCRKLDVPFYNGLFDMAESQQKNSDTHIFRIYMQKLNSIGVSNGYDGRCFDEGEMALTGENTPFDNGNETDMEESVYTWGRGHEVDDYQWLNRKFFEYIGMMDSDTITAIDNALIRNICLEELTILKNRERNRPVNKNLEMWQKLMQSANLRPIDIKNANSSAQADTFGRWVEDIEKNEPAEFFEQEDLFKDFDNVEGYFKNHVLRPLKNLLLGQKDFDIRE